jgi:hypothetical protein
MRLVLLLVGLCVIAYVPGLTLPLIEDDYPNIAQALRYGPFPGSSDLWSDTTFRLRATSYWVMSFTYRLQGMHAMAYHTVSLALHIMATLLVYALTRRWPAMRDGALWAACFFAIHEGHQEAILWFSAINVLLLFVFGIGALLCWMQAGQRPWLHVPGLLLFGLALLSKESAIILLPLFVLVQGGWRWDLLIYAGAASPALLSIAASRATSFRFSDGSFSLQAPFWLILPKNMLRVLWVWGVAAVAAWARLTNAWTPVALATAWIATALLPYAFLTYSFDIPSRQTYLASAGLAMLVGLMFDGLSRRFDRRWSAHSRQSCWHTTSA